MKNTSAFIKTIFLLLSCCFICQTSSAQNEFKYDVSKAGKTLSISSMTPFQVVDVQLYELTPDAIYAIPKVAKWNTLLRLEEAPKIYKFPIEDIRTITYKKKKWNKKGALLGTIAGAVLGYTLGYVQGDDASCSGYCFLHISLSAQQKGTILGSLMGVVGGGVGSQFGLRTRININGSKKKYQQEQKRLKQFILLE